MCGLLGQLPAKGCVGVLGADAHFALFQVVALANGPDVIGHEA
jgi:hypothetical protein